MTTKSKRTRDPNSLVQVSCWGSYTDLLVKGDPGGYGVRVATYSGPGHRAAARRHAAVLRQAMRFDGRNQR